MEFTFYDIFHLLVRICFDINERPILSYTVVEERINYINFLRKYNQSLENSQKQRYSSVLNFVKSVNNIMTRVNEFVLHPG